MIAIVHSIYSQSVRAPARDAGLMDNDAERYCSRDFLKNRNINEANSLPDLVQAIDPLSDDEVNVIDHSLY